MKIWRWLFTALGWLLLATTGAAVLYLAMEPDAVQDRAAEACRWLVIFAGFHWVSHWALGVGLLFLALTALLSPLLRRTSTRLLEFPSEHGSIQVDIGALEQCMEQILNEQEGVIRARVTLRTGTSPARDALGCRAVVWLKASPDVPGRVTRMRERLRAYYLEVLPINENIKVDIRTKLVRQEPQARTVEPSSRLPVQAAPEPAPAPEPEKSESQRSEADYFSGPQYPTDDEDPKTDA